MKEQTRPVFIAEDGSEFFDKEKCQTYERRLELKAIIDEHTVYQDTLIDVNDLVDAILRWANSTI